MSRAYRIAVSESLRRHVTIEDGVCSSLELLSILPQERMSALLAAELADRGFERDGDVMRRVDAGGVVVEVDLAGAAVTIRLEEEHDIELARKARGTTANPKSVDQAEEALRARVKARLESQADRSAELLRQEVTARLERSLGDVQRELDGAVNRATAAALKEKAAQLGEIEEISEDEQTGSLTIRVRV